MFWRIALVVLSIALAAHVPGVAGLKLTSVLPVSYSPGEKLYIRVNSMTSSQAIMPFPFYSLKQCQPAKERMLAERQMENLGEILWGDQIEPSEYSVLVLKNVSCQKLCDLSYDEKEMVEWRKRISNGYRGNMLLDRLPVAQETHAGPRFPKVLVGYPLGAVENPKDEKTKQVVVFNHLHFKILYNEPDVHNDQNEETYRIVGFTVTVHSVNDAGSQTCDPSANFNPDAHPPQLAAPGKIRWTYSTSWVEEPDVAWATRWDIYLRGGENDDRIHWMSILNSTLIVLFLSAMVAMIMMRTLHRDFNRYNDPENENEAKEETGWKLVHGDVFRNPSNPVLLSAIIASGAQLIGMTVSTLGVACFGFLTPSNRGSLLTAVILLYVLLGAYGGYVGARMLKFYKRQNWRNVFFVGILLPGTGMIVYLILNTVQWIKHASSAIPFPTLLLLFGLWCCVSLPLVIVGAAIGYKRPVLAMPCNVNNIPRFIPEQKWYLQKGVMIMTGGVLPFGAAFIELVFVLSSFWQGRLYYMFGFLALAALIVGVTSAEVAIVAVYFQLCNDNYHWWWRSFLVTASSGIYLFGYALYYLATVLAIRQISSMILYVGYMAMASSLFGLVTGAVGFFAAFAFVRKIYGSIKIE